MYTSNRLKKQIYISFFVHRLDLVYIFERYYKKKNLFIFFSFGLNKRWPLDKAGLLGEAQHDPDHHGRPIGDTFIKTRIQFENDLFHLPRLYALENSNPNHGGNKRWADEFASFKFRSDLRGDFRDSLSRSLLLRLLHHYSQFCFVSR